MAAAAPEIEGLSASLPAPVPLRSGGLQDSTLTLAMADPLDFETIAAVRSFSGLRSAPRWRPSRKSSTPSTSTTARPNARRHRRRSGEEATNLEHLRDMASEAPVIRLVNAMIAEAIEKRASDIHIEPFEKEFRVRFRVDGVLFNQEPPPRELKAAIISRLKLMAKLNIAERRLPQDGRIKIKILGREVDLRVSTCPRCTAKAW
jgi:general secretion pathway protein E